MNILVVGANGAIGQAVIEAFCEQYSSAVVYAVSRSHYTGAKRKQVVPVQLDTVNETAITNWLSACKAKGTAFTHAVIATGVLHDPTQLNRQGNDVGTQYRSAIFYHDDEQKAEAEKIIAEITEEKIWPNPVVTEVTPLNNYFAAEDYHQSYFKNNPQNQYCAMVVAPKLAKFKKTFAQRLR